MTSLHNLYRHIKKIFRVFVILTNMVKLEVDRKCRHSCKPTCCILCQILPYNHLTYNGRNSPGNFTFLKDDKKSQVDLFLTNTYGRQHVTNFEIIDTCFHLSDHLSIAETLKLPKTANLKSLIFRSASLADSFTQFTMKPNNTKISHINPHQAIYYLQNPSILSEIEAAIHHGDISEIVDTLHKHMTTASSKSKTVLQKNNYPTMCQEIDCSIKKCDAKYKIYMEYITGEKLCHEHRRNSS